MANYGTQGRVRASSEFVQAGEFNGKGTQYMTTIFTLYDQSGPDGRPIIEVYMKTLGTDVDGIIIPAKAMSEKKDTIAGIDYQYPAVEHKARFGLCFRALVNNLEMAKIQVKYDDVLDDPVLIPLKKNRVLLKNFVGGMHREMHALAIGSNDGNVVGLKIGDEKNGHILVNFLQISYRIEEPLYRSATRGGYNSDGEETYGFASRGTHRSRSGFGAAGTVASGPSGAHLPIGYMKGRTDPNLAAIIDFRYCVFDPKVAPPTIKEKEQKPKYESVKDALSGGPPPLTDVLPIME